MLLSQDEARFPMVPTLAATLGVKGHRPQIGTWDCKDLLYVFAVVNVLSGALLANTLECPSGAGNRHRDGKQDRHQKGNTGGVRLGRFSLLGVFVFLCFHRLPEAITFAVHFKNVAFVGEPIEQRRRHPFALEHLTPLAERQVARDH